MTTVAEDLAVLRTMHLPHPVPANASSGYVPRCALDAETFPCTALLHLDSIERQHEENLVLLTVNTRNIVTLVRQKAEALTALDDVAAISLAHRVSSVMSVQALLDKLDAVVKYDPTEAGPRVSRIERLEREIEAAGERAEAAEATVQVLRDALERLVEVGVRSDTYDGPGGESPSYIEGCLFCGLINTHTVDCDWCHADSALGNLPASVQAAVERQRAQDAILAALVTWYDHGTPGHLLADAETIAELAKALAEGK